LLPSVDPAAVCGKEEGTETGTGGAVEEEVDGPAAVCGKEEGAETGGSEEEEIDGVVTEVAEGGVCTP